MRAQRGHLPAPTRVTGVLRRPGRPLPAAVQADLEPRYGHDFRRVRIHTDAPAAESAAAISAAAYTAGHHIVFGADRYRPHTPAGRRLLAHELAHVVQQGPAPAAARYTLGADPAAERRADAAATAGRVTGLGRVPAGTILRSPTPDQTRFRQLYDEQRANDPGTAHAATLVRAFRDDRISGSTVRDRFTAVIRLAGGNPNAPSATFDPYTIRQTGHQSAAGVGDTGFRRELRDSIHYHQDDQGRDIEMHVASSDQIGHFLSAASFGFSLAERDNYVARQRQAAAEYRRQHPYLSLLRDLFDPTERMAAQFGFERQQYLRAMIGHEKIADRTFSGWGFTSTVASPFMASSEDVQNFLAGRLDRIEIDDSQRGNSYQDLLLTWVGYRFGEHVANDVFPNRQEAARWLELMLTGRDLTAVAGTDPLHAEAQEMQRMLEQFRRIQARTHPAGQPAGPGR